MTGYLILVLSHPSAMDNEALYKHCRNTVAIVNACNDCETILARIGSPNCHLSIDGFFVTNADRSVTYCDVVDLHYFNDCAIRIGYINGQVAKVCGMPVQHWKPPI